MYVHNNIMWLQQLGRTQNEMERWLLLLQQK